MTLTYSFDLEASVRIGIVSDTHGHLDERIARIVTSCDIAIHAGDIVGGHVLKLLRPSSGEVIAVRGNNDHPHIWPREHHAALQQIPEEAVVELPGGKLCISHGDRQWCRDNWHENLRNRFPHARAIVYGHSHYLTCDQEQEPWVINPGAAGVTRTHGGPSCMTLVASNEDWALEVHRFPAAMTESIPA